MELIYLVNALFRKKWIILACTLVAVVAVYILTLNKKPLYTSHAQIETGFTAAEKIKVTDENFNLAQIDTKFNEVIENATSPKVIQLLSYDLILHDLTEKNPFAQITAKDKSSDDYKSLGITSNTAKEFADRLEKMEVLNPNVKEDYKLINILSFYGYDLETLTGNVEVSRLPKTDYINIDFFSTNPNLAAFAVNALVTNLNKYYSYTKLTSTDLSITAIDSIMQAKKIVLDQKLAARSNYLTAHGIVDVTMESGNKLGQLSTLQNQLSDEKSKLPSLSYRIGQLTNLIDKAKASGKTVVSTSEVPKVEPAGNTEYVALKKKYNDLYNEYIRKGFNSPDIKRQLDDLTDQMGKLNVNTKTPEQIESTETTVDALEQRRMEAEADLRSTNEKISLIQSSISGLNGGLSGMAASSAEIQKINSDIDIATREYTSAKDRLNSVISLAQGYDGFKQTIFGQPSLTPEPSKRLIFIAFGGCAGLFLSMLVIVLLEYLDQSIKTPSQFYRLTNLPLLGIVNHINKLGGNVLDHAGTIEGDDKKRHNVFRELLRKVRYEMEQSGKRIFLFTSTEAGQGKTTLIQAISYSLSLGKKKVLIIDTNFCNNDLTELLAAKPLLEKFYVNGKPFSMEDAKKLITKTAVEGIDTIGCGSGDYTPSEILPKNHLLNYLPELLNEYDFILLEGAPLNKYTDSKELVEYSDGLIAVFGSDASLSATDKESISFLKQNKDKFIGAILNKVKTEDLNL